MILPFEFRHLEGRINVTRLESGIDWLHIEDPKVQNILVSVRVAAGSFDESRIGSRRFYDGIAHLTEHSVFLKMTPEQKSQFSYTNAFTDDQQTQYLFTTTNNLGSSSLQLIASNLFNFSTTPKIRDEVKAVESE